MAEKFSQSGTQTNNMATQYSSVVQNGNNGENVYEDDEYNDDTSENSETDEEVSSQKDPSKTDTNEKRFSDVKSVFIVEKDLYGDQKPEPKEYLTHTELFKSIDR